MMTLQRVSSLRSAIDAARKERKVIGFVPTMGNLHEGHLALVRAAKSRCDYVVVSIYVNPTQFGANEDLDAYPHTPEEDARQLAELEVDALFLPSHEVMYPSELSDQTVVWVPNLGDRYCGEDRPHHFQGVTTVVARLFNMVTPDLAVFGKKDFQQLVIIERMVRDLAFPVQIVGVETVREASGLALSSRNGYLNRGEQKIAPRFYELLVALASTLSEIHEERGLSARRVTIAQNKTITELEAAGFSPNFVTLCDRHTLSLPDYSDDGIDQTELVILASASLGKARLIDNVELSLANNES